MKKILLIGGSSIDYIATSDEPLDYDVSNNGSVHISYGGVMRNVAYNLSMLGNKVTFITAIGNDNNGELLKKHLAQIKVKYISPISKLPTSSYVAVNDSDHDMALAIFDNRIEGDINPKYIESLHKEINKFDYLVLDANLSNQAIEYIVNKYHKTKKIFCESVSPQLVVRYKNVLDKIFFIKCNIHEARALVHNHPLEKEELIKALFNEGLKNVCVSNAKFDIYYGLNGKEIYCFKIKPHVRFKNTTGCGDALFSGIIDQLSIGKDFHSAIKFGNKLSNLTLMSDSANSEEVTKYAHK